MAVAVQLPTVHLNGTSQDELVELRMEVVDNLRETLEALGKATPNGRDYYMNDGSLKAALDQHNARINMIRTLMREIEEEAIAISDME